MNTTASDPFVEGNVIYKESDVQDYDVVLNHPARWNKVGHKNWNSKELRGERRTIQPDQAQTIVQLFETARQINGEWVIPKILYRMKKDGSTSDRFYRRATIEEVINNVKGKRSSLNSNKRKAGPNAELKPLRAIIADYHQSLCDLEEHADEYRPESQTFRKTLDALLAIPFTDEIPIAGKKGIVFGGYSAIETAIEIMWDGLLGLYFESSESNTNSATTPPSSGDSNGPSTDNHTNDDRSQDGHGMNESKRMRSCLIGGTRNFSACDSGNVSPGNHNCLLNKGTHKFAQVPSKLYLAAASSFVSCGSMDTPSDGTVDGRSQGHSSDCDSQSGSPNAACNVSAIDQTSLFDNLDHECDNAESESSNSSSDACDNEEDSIDEGEKQETSRDPKKQIGSTNSSFESGGKDNGDSDGDDDNGEDRGNVLSAMTLVPSTSSHQGLLSSAHHVRRIFAPAESTSPIAQLEDQSPRDVVDTRTQLRDAQSVGVSRSDLYHVSRTYDMSSSSDRTGKQAKQMWNATHDGSFKKGSKSNSRDGSKASIDTAYQGIKKQEEDMWQRGTCLPLQVLDNPKACHSSPTTHCSNQERQQVQHNMAENRSLRRTLEQQPPDLTKKIRNWKFTHPEKMVRKLVVQSKKNPSAYLGYTQKNGGKDDNGGDDDAGDDARPILSQNRRSTQAALQLSTPPFTTIGVASLQQPPFDVIEAAVGGDTNVVTIDKGSLTTDVPPRDHSTVSSITTDLLLIPGAKFPSRRGRIPSETPPSLDVLSSSKSVDHDDDRLTRSPSKSQDLTIIDNRHELRTSLSDEIPMSSSPMGDEEGRPLISPSSRPHGRSSKWSSRKEGKRQRFKRKESLSAFLTRMAESFRRSEGQRGASIEILRGSGGADFEGQAHIVSEDAPGGCGCMNIDELAEKHLLIKGAYCFVFIEEDDMAPKYAIPLANARATMRDTYKDKTIVTLERHGNIEYEISFSCPIIAKGFRDAVTKQSALARAQKAARKHDNSFSLKEPSSVRYANAVATVKVECQPKKKLLLRIKNLNPSNVNYMRRRPEEEDVESRNFRRTSARKRSLICRQGDPIPHGHL